MIISDLEKDENEYGEGLGVWRGGGTRLARCPINEEGNLGELKR